MKTIENALYELASIRVLLDVSEELNDAQLKTIRQRLKAVRLALASVDLPDQTREDYSERAVNEARILQFKLDNYIYE